MISGENVSHGNYEDTYIGIDRDGLLLKKQIDLASTRVILVDLIQSCMAFPCIPHQNLSVSVRSGLGGHDFR